MSMTVQEMQMRLQQHFPDAEIEVIDLTGGQDHWEVYVSSTIFTGRSRMEQHQMVMKAFTDELRSGEVHALSIKTAQGKV
jgi:stress-induced morphogen